MELGERFRLIYFHVLRRDALYMAGCFCVLFDKVYGRGVAELNGR